MKLSQRMSTQMKLSPQVVVASKLLRASQEELVSALAGEIAANPALVAVRSPAWQRGVVPCSPAADQSTPPAAPYRSIASRTSAPASPGDAADDLLERLPALLSVFDQLAVQIKQISSGTPRLVALLLVHCLDHRGYLSAAPERLAQELDLPLDHVLEGVAVLHQLEPPGIGARACASVCACSARTWWNLAPAQPVRPALPCPSSSWPGMTS